MEDRVKGSFVGKCLGDAIGAPYEFVYNRGLPYTDLIRLPTRHRSRWQGERNSAVGQVTDDTEMTIALMLSITRGVYDSRAALLRYIEWVNSGTYMMGVNTHYLFKNIRAKREARRLETFSKRYSKKFGHEPVYTGSAFTQKDDTAQSNGSLMRCSPLAVFKSNEPALVDCQLTNPTDVNRDASVVYVRAIRACLKGEKRKNLVLFEAMMAAQTPAITEALSDAHCRKDRDISTRNKGWVAHAIYAAFYAFVVFDDFKSAMRWIVERKSGDTDTNAAIAGALIGAYYGYECLVGDETTAQNWRIVCTVDTKEGDNVRPPLYDPGNTDSLIARLYSIAKVQLSSDSDDDDEARHTAKKKK